MSSIDRGNIYIAPPRVALRLDSTQAAKPHASQQHYEAEELEHEERHRYLTG